MSLDAKQLLTKAVKNLPETESGQIKQKPTAVVIRFSNLDYIDDTKEALNALFPELKRYESLLIGFYRNRADAQVVTNSIGYILDRYNNNLIANPFEQNWLTEYFKLKSHGVEMVMVANELNNALEIPSYLEKTAIDKVKMGNFHSKCKSAKLECMSYTGELFINHCAEYAFNNWDGLSTEAEVVKLFTDMHEILYCETKGKHLFSRHPAQETLFAIKKKARALFKADVAAKQVEPNDKLCSQILSKTGIEEEFAKLVESSEKHILWDHCRKLLSSYLKENAKDIAPKGLLLLMENYDEDLEDKEPDDALFKKPKDFPFINFSFTMDGCISTRLSPKRLRYDIQEQGGELLDLIAGAVAAYYLQIMEFKQDVKFRALLHEHSKVMDEKPFYDHWLELAEESRPNP